MAISVKDFKVKAGLVVEGANGTINGFDILTKKELDQDYIVSLIGGTATPDNTPDTVVKRDGNGDFAANAVEVFRLNIGSVGYIEDDGSIEIVNTDGDDINITADDIRLNAADDVILSAGDQGSVHGDVVLTTSGGVIKLDAADVYVGSSEIDSERVATRGYVDQAELDAVSSANSHTDTALLDYTTTANLDAHIDSHLSGGDGVSYSAGVISADVANGLEITDGHIVVDRDTVDTWYDANGAASTAQTNAINHTNTALEDYTPTASLDATIDGYGYLKSADLGDYATQTYVNDAVEALVDGAPGLLDTLNEIAAAINDDENYATTMTTALAGKQNNLTAGDNISIVSDTISVTGLDSADISDFNTAAVSANTGLWDTLGAAAEALEDAEAYADQAELDAVATANLYTDARETAITAAYESYADTAEADAKSYADGLVSDLQDAVDALDTDDVAEGAANQYFTDSRAKDSAADLLTNATLANITITGTGAGLTITAESGVADATTDDLEEGEDNLYFTEERAIDAISNADIYPNAVIIDNVAKQVATSTLRATAGTHVAVAFAKAEYRSAEFLVKVAYGDYTEISKVLLTLDVNDNISITEYGIVGTNGSGMSVTADVNGANVELRVITTNNNTTVTAVGTLLV